MPRPLRLVLLLLPVLLAVLALGLFGWSAPAAAAAGVWPVEPPVVLRGFEPPPADWEPGHRGIDLAAGLGAAVVAPADGTVAFAGTVVGRGVVVVSLPEGLRTTLEPVSPTVHPGDVVLAGDQVGTLQPRPHCGWTPCLHWGLRRGDSYLDPRLLLGLAPPVLLPLPAPVSGSWSEPRTPAAERSLPGTRGSQTAGGAVEVPPQIGDGSLPGRRALLAAGGWPGREAWQRGPPRR